MARRTGIRWKDGEYDQLKKLVKNYNAKVVRDRKKLLNGNERYRASGLPEKASLVKMKHMTRKDMEAERARLTGYVKYGEEYPIYKRDKDGNKVETRTSRMLDATVRDFNKKVDRTIKSIEKETEAAIKERRELKASMKGMKKGSADWAKSEARVKELDAVVHSKQGRIAAMPAKLDKEKLIKGARSAKELEGDLKLYKGFLEKGAEELVAVPGNNNNIKQTKWQKEMFETYLPGVNERRQAELDAWLDAEVKYAGEDLGYTRRKIGAKNNDLRLEELTVYNPSSTNADLREKFNMVFRERKSDYWDRRANMTKQIYVKKLKQLVGNSAAGEELVKLISDMDTNAFKRILTEENDIFGLLYDLQNADSSSFDAILSRIWSEWRDDDYFEWNEAYRKKNKVRLYKLEKMEAAKQMEAELAQIIASKNKQ